MLEDPRLIGPDPVAGVLVSTGKKQNIWKGRVSQCAKASPAQGFPSSLRTGPGSTCCALVTSQFLPSVDDYS